MHEVLVNRLGGLSLPRKSVVRLTDRPDMTLDVYRGRKTTKQQQQQHQNINFGVTSACRRVETVQKSIDIHTQKLKMLSYRSIDLEARSRRNNLVFWGITKRTSRNCENLILSFIEREMRIDITGMAIDRAHRIGSTIRANSANRDDFKRPIIVRFRNYRDTDHILENAYRLKGTNFGVDRDYPKEILDARKRLYKSKEAFDARKCRQKVQIRYPAKLFINDRLVRDEFPEWSSYMKVSRIEGFRMIGVANIINNICRQQIYSPQIRESK